MPYSNYRPDLMGSATLSPSGSVEAGSWQTFELVYTAGRFGIDDTGSLKIAMRFATDFGPVQFDDPAAPGYTTVVASNGATLECRWEFKRNIRPWSRALYIGIQKHFLKEGDTVTIRFGDTSGGSRGVRVQTYCESKFEFKVFVDAIATYDYVALPDSPHIAIVPGPPVTWRAVLPTLRATGDAFRLSIKAEDAWGNPSDQVDRVLKLHSSLPVDGLPETTEFPPGSFSLVLEDLRVDKVGDLSIDVLDPDGALLCQTNSLRITDTPSLLHFWGDLHGQSNETLGTNTAEEYFLFGRDRAFLDLCSHQGNDFQMTGEFWVELNELTARLNEPGRFVTFPGYEWSANTAIGGDRNVFYLTEGRPIYRSSHAQIEDLSDEANDGHTAHELFEHLQDEDCVCWSHCGGRYADITFAHDGRLETAVEVHSSWGTFEWLLHDAFSKDYRVGVVCNSDGHKGRVGASFPGASFFGAYGGLTCYLAPELTRAAIFETMRRRHHYGTTGARIYLDVRATPKSGAKVFLQDPSVVSNASCQDESSLIMGDIAKINDDDVELAIEVVGSSAIERIDVFDGLELLSTFRSYDENDLGDRVRITYSGAEYRGRSRTTNWDGELTVEGNEIVRAEMFNNWNLDRGIQECSAHALSWKAVTSGNFGGIDLWLAGTGGCISLNTKHATADVAVSDLGVAEMVVDAGGLDRKLTLQRLPNDLQAGTVRYALKCPVKADGDTRLYIRVQQIDGHRAWSSPIYLFR
ncbi:MAG: DUF3604 domain-containing protein [Rhizobiales bacterium]|nr:DUF3604 domain-containing protein [Hyphomicrobiales bacterium]